MESELRHAVEKGQLHLHYQPIVNLSNSKISGFEALARWTHPTIGAVSPAEFIPIAEETGLIVDLGSQVLRDACRQMAEWTKQCPEFCDMQMSVNLSSIQIRDTKVVAQILAVLEEFELRPENLRIEVTESAIMENPTHGGVALSKLREQGVKVAIDDFGTGYSSLAYIHQLSPNVVKIDRSFVDQITLSTDKATIVGAIIALAEGLNLDVVAEGIETEAQRKLLYSMGCSHGQGFLFARPMSPRQILDFATSSKSVLI